MWSVEESSSQTHVFFFFYLWFFFLLWCLFLWLLFLLLLNSWLWWSGWSWSWASNFGETSSDEFVDIFSFQGFDESVEVIIWDVDIGWSQNCFKIGGTLNYCNCYWCCFFLRGKEGRRQLNTSWWLIKQIIILIIYVIKWINKRNDHFFF